MIKFDKINVPKEGKKIEVRDEKISVPDNPIIPFIEGDGIGPDIMKASQRVWNAAVDKAYGAKKYYQRGSVETILRLFGGRACLGE